MSVLQVLHIPDERLRKVAKPVEEVNAEIQRIVDDMFETMYAEEGIGLAATQVDIHQRIIVIDVSENRDERLVLINPELLEKSGETGIEEGCLSIPEQRALVPRAEKVKIRALDRDGKPFELEADGLLAICIQHEMDHLVGKLFMDYLSPLKQQRIRQKVEKLEYLDQHKTKGSKLAFVGDGINDAPVLARADVGIAMGGLGSDAAIEAADVVLMTDEPSKLVDAIDVAKATKRIVMQNIIIALGIKSVFLILGALGIAGMWEAVFGDVGVTIIAVLNAMRILKK